MNDPVWPGQVRLMSATVRAYSGRMLSGCQRGEPPRPAPRWYVLCRHLHRNGKKFSSLSTADADIQPDRFVIALHWHIEGNEFVSAFRTTYS